MAARQNAEFGPNPDWGLTRRQAEFLALLKTGARNAEIAATLHITRNTVKTHRRHLYAKIGEHNRIKVLRLVWELEPG